MDNMFKNINNIISIESIKTYKNSSIKILSMRSVFEGCINLKKISINNFFDTSELKSLLKLFYNSGVEILDITNFDTKNVEDISFMFSSTKLNKIEFLKEMRTNNVKNMSYLFKNCLFLEKINMSSFETNNIEDISSMFENCNSLKTIDMGSFNGFKIKNMSNLFSNCTNLT